MEISESMTSKCILELEVRLNEIAKLIKKLWQFKVEGRLSKWEKLKMRDAVIFVNT